MFKTASIFLFDYICEHNLLYKVKLCIPAHDEWNIEVPEEIADEMLAVVKDCMKRAGAFFCTKVELPAEGDVLDFCVHRYGNKCNNIIYLCYPTLNCRYMVLP